MSLFVAAQGAIVVVRKGNLQTLQHAIDVPYFTRMVNFGFILLVLTNFLDEVAEMDAIQKKRQDAEAMLAAARTEEEEEQSTTMSFPMDAAEYRHRKCDIGGVDTAVVKEGDYEATTGEKEVDTAVLKEEGDYDATAGEKVHTVVAKDGVDEATAGEEVDTAVLRV